tara:strand:+ start:1579 stop:2313 length:735 start_codon:yes stop_codon:yes gene_type:complete
MRDIFVGKGKKGKNPLQDQMILENRLRNDPVYQAQFTGHGYGYGDDGDYGFNMDAAKDQYLYDLNTDPRNTAAIDYARRINEDEAFAETQGGKMRKLAKRLIDADPKGGYGISNTDQALALDKLKYKYWKKNLRGEDGGGAYNSANDLDLVYDGMKSRVSDYDFGSMADEIASKKAKDAARDKDQKDGYELSPELNSSIDRNQEFEDKRYAGEIFADAFNEVDSGGFERENPFLFKFADRMRYS